MNDMVNELYPRVLVVSNECISYSTSNGRTIGNLFHGWDKNTIANFCISLADPNVDICDNYFCVTDKQALTSIIKGECKPQKLFESKDTEGVYVFKSGIKKTSFSMLMRHIVWSLNRWRGKLFGEWIDNFAPQLVIIQSGDSAFMHDIALSISKRRNIPLVFFNTEGYYHFKRNFFSKHWADFACHPIYMRIYRKHFRQSMKYASHFIYLNELLRKDFDHVFGSGKSSVLYTTSLLPFIPKNFDSDNPRFSYIGNLGYKRIDALKVVANCLSNINPKYKLDVYSAHRLATEDNFKDCPAINFCGALNYDGVVDVMRKSDLIFHVESSSSEVAASLKYGFTTKIADCLASGSNFLLFAPDYIACSRYIKDNEAAWYANSSSALQSVLKEFFLDSKKRETYILKARIISSLNHDEKRNSQVFFNIIKQAILTYKP